MPFLPLAQEIIHLIHNADQNLYFLPKLFLRPWRGLIEFLIVIVFVSKMKYIYIIIEIKNELY